MRFVKSIFPPFFLNNVQIEYGAVVGRVAASVAVHDGRLVTVAASLPTTRVRPSASAAL